MELQEGDRPVFTIIVRVCHSSLELSGCLESLERLDYPERDFNVLLVDTAGGTITEDCLSSGKYVLRTTVCTFEGSGAGMHHWAALRAIRKKPVPGLVPGRYYVFTEDDCRFEPRWLRNFEEGIGENTGALGGPELLPEEMGWFSQAADIVLTANPGSVGRGRRKAAKEGSYYPRKHNMMVPAAVVDRLGYLPERTGPGTELAMGRRIRDLGLSVALLPENFVWHRRSEGFPFFVGNSIFTAREKTLQLLRGKTFYRSLHGTVLAGTLVFFLLGLLALHNAAARYAAAALLAAYLAAVLALSAAAAYRRGNPAVGFGAFILFPCMQAGAVVGVVQGFLRHAAGPRAGRAT